MGGAADLQDYMSYQLLSSREQRLVWLRCASQLHLSARVPQPVLRPSVGNGTNATGLLQVTTVGEPFVDAMQDRFALPPSYAKEAGQLARRNTILEAPGSS